MVMARRIRDFRDDEHGGALVEALLVMNVILLMLVAFIELTIAVNQWNAANKALQLGARIASVSTPLHGGLMTIDPVADDQAEPGDPMPDFGTLSCTLSDCDNQADVDRIVQVMQRLFPRVEAENVTIAYSWAGLGYAGRPGGPVPLINLTMSGVPFDFMLLGAFIGQDTLTIPDFTVTAVGEDLSTTY